MASERLGRSSAARPCLNGALESILEQALHVVAIGADRRAVGIGRIEGREVEFDSVSSGELVGGEQGFADICLHHRQEGTHDDRQRAVLHHLEIPCELVVDDDEEPPRQLSWLEASTVSGTMPSEIIYPSFNRSTQRSESWARAAPLRRLVALVDQRMLERIAEEHKRGRRLIVVTTRTSCAAQRGLAR